MLSCVPRQHSSFIEKLRWLRNTLSEHRPDLLITPQEYFGGIVMMPHQPHFHRSEVLPRIQELCTEFNCGMVAGVLERDDDGCNREAIWFLDRGGEFKGRVCKFALPRYDHITTHGGGAVTPELEFDKRFITFDICGLRAAAIFCWEVYSDLLWTGLGLLRPDVVFSLIKFGPNAWPSVEMQQGRMMVKGFGYGSWAEEGRWIERLRVASLWQVKCPIISSTNSWNLRPVSMPICGCICELDGQATPSLWHPTKEDKLKSIPERIVVDTLSPSAIQATLENKWKYKDATGQFPPYSLGRYTMMLKIRRIETRILCGKEAAKLGHRQGGFLL